jgi:ferric-dicitrate binding protein FerR (iron transport regulator)
MLRAKKDQTRVPAADVPSRILDEAIAWAVKLSSGTARPEDHEACAAWRDQDPAHEQAWQRLQTVDQQFRLIPGGANQLACRTLEQADRYRSASRRQVLKIAVLAAMAGCTGLLVRRSPWRRQATYTSAVGTRRPINLADGSRLLLNSNTIIDVVFTPLCRTILLRQGEVFIETGADPASPIGSREFWVETPHARLEAIGTRFLVREETNQTRLQVTDGAVAVQLESGHVIFRPGDMVWVDTTCNFLRRVDYPDHDPMAWTRGAIVARRMRLEDFARELNRQYATQVRVDPDVAELRVSGVFQLDGANAFDRILNALTNTLPIKMIRAGEHCVMIIKMESNQ